MCVRVCVCVWGGGKSMCVVSVWGKDMYVCVCVCVVVLVSGFVYVYVCVCVCVCVY